MRIAIIGWGVEGQSAYHFFGPDNEYLIANEEPRDDFPPESDNLHLQFISSERDPGLTGNVKDLSYLAGIEQYDKIVYSVTSYLNLKQVFGDDPDFWAKTTTVNQIFFETVDTRNIIGVTGTKGKGTTSTLITKMLEANDKKVYLGGNIGRGVLDFVKDVEPTDWVVLELSSFQLMNLHHSPRIAVCLMITTEHMDWHSGMEEYVEAKGNIFRYQHEDDYAVYYALNDFAKRIAYYSPGRKIPYFESPGASVREDGMIVIGDKEVIHKNEVKLLGQHNLQNICAALTAFGLAGGKISSARSVLTSFSGLEHRLELVRTLEGVRYFDDSFATTPEASIVALKAFEQPKVVILGGSDKGLNFAPLADAVVKENVKHVIAIGHTAEKITNLLNERGYEEVTTGLSAMPAIVAATHEVAEPGDVVLLSTACASFGLFKNYKDRGNQFKAAVQAL